MRALSRSRRGSIVNVLPWAVIEIVSPDDTIGTTAPGSSNMIQSKFEALELPAGTVPFDSEDLFRRLIAELMNRRGQ